MQVCVGGDGGWGMEDGRGGVGGTHNNSLQPLRLLELASLFEKLQSSFLFPAAMRHSFLSSV